MDALIILATIFTVSFVVIGMEWWWMQRDNKPEPPSLFDVNGPPQTWRGRKGRK